jgi:quercetin dioxygenase-like cupin family protein
MVGWEDRPMKTVRFFMAPLLAAAAIAAIAAEHPHQFPGCIPVAQRAGEKLGCFITANQMLGKLPNAPIFWHLYEYPNRAAADGAAKTIQGTVVESYGRVWLFNVSAAEWNPAGGRRIARIGPLPVSNAASYSAAYMEATFTPGMQSAVHRHPGPEAWYVLAGEQCLETPGHKRVIHAGESGIVEEGPPMRLTGTGTGERRALVLILHDSSKPMTVPASDWTPAGLCNG